MRRGDAPPPVVPAIVPRADRSPPWVALVGVPITRPAYEVVQEHHTTARHCFSVCLYREPTFEQRFPGRDFWRRYLQPVDEIRALLTRHNAHLKIWCDRLMLDTVIAMDLGDIYLVTDPPAHPWAQHLWRYYSTLLPYHESIQAYHFRGLDNIVHEDMAMLDRFVDGRYDVLRAAYRRGARSLYTPVRGSVSLARNGILSLRHRLCTRAPRPLSPVWPEPFHIDEAFLAAWWRASYRHLDTMTYVDRRPTSEIFVETRRAMLCGRRVHLEGLIRADGPMWRRPIDDRSAARQTQGSAPAHY